MTERELVEEFSRWKRLNGSTEIHAVQLPTGEYNELVSSMIEAKRYMSDRMPLRLSGIEVYENPYLLYTGAFIGPDHCALGLFRL